MFQKLCQNDDIRGENVHFPKNYIDRGLRDAGIISEFYLRVHGNHENRTRVIEDLAVKNELTIMRVRQILKKRRSYGNKGYSLQKV